MNWQVNYALKNLSKDISKGSVQHLRDEAILIASPNHRNVVAVISAAYTVSFDLAQRYHASYPEMDFLCGYRKDCVWEGPAIEYLESNRIGWGSAGTLGSAIYAGDANTSAHKDFSFSYRIIKQLRSITNLSREFDRVFRMTLPSGRTVRVGMILEYEPTADAIRTFWDRFGPIDVAWNINPNGDPTSSAIEAGLSLGCEVMKWEELRDFIKTR